MTAETRSSYSPPTADLIERAKGISRAEAMKKVVGPALAHFLHPVFDIPLSEEETAYMPELHTFGDIVSFGEEVKKVTHGRLDELKARRSIDYSLIEDLHNARPDLFYHQNAYMTLTDGIDSAIVTPLTVAGQIYQVENGMSKLVNGRGRQPIIPGELTDILRRDNFDETLMHLTKGPNGFLGAASSYGVGGALTYSFFNFYNPDGEPLHIDEAFITRAGRVAGLSGKYHLAANGKRRDIKDTYERPPRNVIRFEFGDSSGCPLRHRFKGPDGEEHDPLVIYGKEFLINALEVSSSKLIDEAQYA